MFLVKAKILFVLIPNKLLIVFKKRYADSILGSLRYPGGGHGQPTHVFFPGESHGQRSLVGYNPWGFKESDMTEVT